MSLFSSFGVRVSLRASLGKDDPEKQKPKTLPSEMSSVLVSACGTACIMSGWI